MALPDVPSRGSFCSQDSALGSKRSQEVGGKMSRGCCIPATCTWIEAVLFLSLRALLIPPQSLPRAEVSAWLAGGQGHHGEEEGAARMEEAALALGRTGSWLGWLWGGTGDTPPRWGG